MKRAARLVLDLAIIGVLAGVVLICAGYLLGVLVVFVWVVLGAVTIRG